VYNKHKGDSVKIHAHLAAVAATSQAKPSRPGGELATFFMSICARLGMGFKMDDKFIVRPRKPAYGKTSVVSARLPDDLIKRLDSVSQRTGRTRNELLVMCTEYALDNIEIKDD
jgi:hypothetical protein